MSNLMEMLGGGGGRREEYEDFVQRFDRGKPWEGIDDDEARQRYDEVSSELPDDDYELSAREAFERLDPQERKQMAQMLRQRGRQQQVDLGEFDQDDDERLSDPKRLAAMTRHVRKKQPGGLGALLGGGGGVAGNPLAKAALSGIAAMAAKKFMR